MMASNDYRTSPGLFAFLDKVSALYALLVVDISEVLRQLVIADTSCIHHRVSGQDVLGK